MQSRIFCKSIKSSLLELKEINLTVNLEKTMNSNKVVTIYKIVFTIAASLALFLWLLFIYGLSMGFPLDASVLGVAAIPSVSELSGFVIGSLAAAFVLLSWIALLVIRNPKLSEELSLPIGIFFFLFGMVRLLTFGWVGSLQSVSPVLVGEAILFSLLGMVIGNARTDNKFSGVFEAFLSLNKDFLMLPKALTGWVMVLM
ncbi:MAG: hypothetical protein QNL04_01400, partial [SAR324 cluster bacterium]|nr:hypothetical protein [SAR324 cluster bacterium]